MKVRYCDTILQEWRPCDVGWGSLDEEGCKGCSDMPIEEKCRNIVDSADTLFCPTCGTALGTIGGVEDNG